MKKDSKKRQEQSKQTNELENASNQCRNYDLPITNSLVQTHGRKLKGMMLGLFGNCHAILLGMKLSNVGYFPSFIKREREGERGGGREREGEGERENFYPRKLMCICRFISQLYFTTITSLNIIQYSLLWITDYISF